MQISGSVVPNDSTRLAFLMDATAGFQLATTNRDNVNVARRFVKLALEPASRIPPRKAA
jgi:hypothetical protein